MTAVVEYDGVPIGYMEGWEDQAINACYFFKGIRNHRDYPDRKNAMRLGDVDAVVISEVLRDLKAIAHKAE